MEKMSDWYIKLPAEKLLDDDIALLVAHKKLRKGNCINWCKQVTLEDDEPRFLYEIKPTKPEERKDGSKRETSDEEDSAFRDPVHVSTKPRANSTTRKPLPFSIPSTEPLEARKRTEIYEDDDAYSKMIGEKRKPFQHLLNRNTVMNYAPPASKSKLLPDHSQDLKAYGYERPGKHKHLNIQDNQQTRTASQSKSEIDRVASHSRYARNENVASLYNPNFREPSTRSRNPIESITKRTTSQSNRSKDQVFTQISWKPKVENKSRKLARQPISKSQVIAEPIEDISNSSSVQNEEQSSSLVYEKVKRAPGSAQKGRYMQAKLGPVQNIQTESDSEKSPGEVSEYSPPPRQSQKTASVVSAQEKDTASVLRVKSPPAEPKIPESPKEFPFNLSRSCLARLASTPEALQVVIDQLFAIHVLFGVDIQVAAKRWLILGDRDRMLQEILEEYTPEDVAVVVI